MDDIFRLIVTTKNGDRNIHYFEDYDTLDYNAVLCQFSPNIIKAVAQEATLLGWKTLFSIEESNKK